MINSGESSRWFQSRVASDYSGAIFIYIEPDLNHLHVTVGRVSERQFVIWSIYVEKLERSLQCGFVTTLLREFHLGDIFAHLDSGIVKPGVMYIDFLNQGATSSTLLKV